VTRRVPPPSARSLVALLGSSFTGSVGELQALGAAALADLRLHSAGLRALAGGLGGAPSAAAAAASAQAALMGASAQYCSATAALLAAAPPGPPAPLLAPHADTALHLEAGAALGGALHVYPEARLLAAAVWRRYLEVRPGARAWIAGDGATGAAWRRT
jgi:hypothetical protein